jgi:predicted DNA-binding transcriptional regulator YafY
MDRRTGDDRRREPRDTPERRQEVCVKAYAAHVGVHPRTVYRWIKDGALDGVRRYGRNGRTIRIEIHTAV